MRDIDIDDPKPGDVEILISHGTSNEPPYRTVHLEIVEEISRQRIIDVRLTPAQFGTLLGSTSVYASADLPANPDRIGKRVEVDVQTVSNVGAKASQESLAETMAQAYRDAGWDTVQTSRSNKGLVVTARRWVAP